MKEMIEYVEVDVWSHEVRLNQERTRERTRKAAPVTKYLGHREHTTGTRRALESNI